MNNFWDKIQGKYRQSIRDDKNADFAYERLVNTPSLLSLCDEDNKYVLDLGCGDGRFTKKLEDCNGKVVGLDYSHSLLKFAKRLCTKSTFVNCDLEKPFPKFNVKFNLITAKLLLMYINDLDNLAKESFNNLEIGGSLVISVTHPIKWIHEANKGNIENHAYKGYLSEVLVNGKIANDKGLKTVFLNRTLQTYTNTFTKHGFVLKMIQETGVPDFFVIKYPSYLEFQSKPYRLNMKFIKP